MKSFNLACEALSDLNTFTNAQRFTNAHQVAIRKSSKVELVFVRKSKPSILVIFNSFKIMRSSIHFIS
jgi:hypothetical protein